ncbi:MAG: hypothetical protein QNJ46_20555 [Leptolyngbyaceae cyanobacterium MO_188.B28]|nr:hypothetical protein [Leptolyngbyaceae cyanobacterium MO_188.B28]
MNATALPPLIPATAIAVNHKYGDFDATFVEGVGHYLMLEQPEQFN